LLKLASRNSTLWDGSPGDSALYDVSVEALSDTEVRLTGRKSGEIVTIVW